LLHSIDETYEAKAIASEIKELLASGVNANEIAVLYRINALSRSLEEGFNKAKLAFKMVGGIRFYERAEIKDIISYLRVISNSDDDFSLLRIINKPKRGIGATTIEKIKNFAATKGTSIFAALDGASKEELEKILSKKALKELLEFIDTIKLLQKEKEHLGELINLFDAHIGLRDYYGSMVDGFERVLNIDEFYGYFRDAIMKEQR